MSHDTRKGGCLCGAVTFETRGAPRFVSNCHCNTCRRAASAPSVTWAGFADDQVTISGATLSNYTSSPGATRSFCGQCGSPVAFRGERWPGEVHLPVCAFEAAADMAPQNDYFASEKLPWTPLFVASH